jgi:hypothetical protein
MKDTSQYNVQDPRMLCTTDSYPVGLVDELYVAVVELLPQLDG